ncbi:MAG: dTDP-4-dehydrorhamnose 3,5-epimerase family protein [Patescibacteria group bacterium]|jgi:dTDP-4-dehydrorhamnose 3,5-epimerase
MIAGVIVKQLQQYDDSRGWLAEFWRSDGDAYRPAMGYISVTEPGVARGPHEHVKQTDCFVFVGPGSFRLYLWDNRKGSPTFGEYYEAEMGENNKAAVIIPPGVVHGYKCISAVPGQVINLADQLYKGENKKAEVDEIRWEGMADSPFKI